MKYTQNPALGEYLMSSKGFGLVEATRELPWGCGVSLHQCTSPTAVFSGENLSGQILMELRQMLLNKASREGVSYDSR
jgi:predicted NAD-dependent protein-ADP-ribosyltransferase YbiA (DUF1768 family)